MIALEDVSKRKLRQLLPKSLEDIPHTKAPDTLSLFLQYLQRLSLVYKSKINIKKFQEVAYKHTRKRNHNTSCLEEPTEAQRSQKHDSDTG